MVTETENGSFVDFGFEKASWEMVLEKLNNLTDRIFCVFACRSFAGESQ